MSAASKERIDVLLVEQGYYESREKAKAAIMAGLVIADGERIEKKRHQNPQNRQHYCKGCASSLCKPRRIEAGEGYWFFLD